MITILGIDEVGRGCLAGPLVVGAVILNEPIDGIKDSKLLTKAKREELSLQIQLTAKASALGWVSASEVDRLGLTQATALAITRALEEVKVAYDLIIIDGSVNFLKDNPKVKTIIKADQTVPAVSAASIIAKVARDNYMNEQDALFPNYGFSKHVGYGSPEHLRNIEVHGACELHRLSFSPLKDIKSRTAKAI